ncbi:MAG: sugar-binding protein [Defluviitaleaceae bacterium]|nr:sugar-binding protein [Defluviitaleaceae bacterium]
MNIFKKTLGVLAISIGAIALTACGDGASSNNDGAGTIGIVLPSTDLPRWLQDEQRFIAALEGTDFNSTILFSQDSPSVELQNVETLITQQVDVIILTPVDGTAAAAAANAAYAAGIPLIAYDRLIMGTPNLPYYVTFDSYAVGYAMGRFLAENATGTGNPLYLYAGHPADNNAFLFFEGSWSALQPYVANGTFVIYNSSEAVALQNNPTLTREQMAGIIGQVTTEWTNDTARNLAEAHLTMLGSQGKGEVFVLAPNDGTSLAISDAFNQDPEITRLWITGQDAEISSVQGIIDGRQSMTVFKDVRMLVNDAIDVAIAIIEGRTPSTEGYFDNGIIQVPSKLTEVIVVDIYNLRSILIDSGYYEEGQFNWANY